MKSMMSKQMRSRLLSVLLLVVMLTALLPVSAMAEDDPVPGPAITVTAGEPDAEGKFLVTITVDSFSAGLSMLSFNLNFDTTKFSFVGGTDDVLPEASVKAVDNSTAGDGVIVAWTAKFFTSEGVTTWTDFIGGKFLTLQLQTKPGAYGSSSISLAKINASKVSSNSSEKDIIYTCTANNATVTLPSVTVTYNNNGHGGDAPTAQEMAPGGKANEPTAPSADGYTFDGWYTEASVGTKWDFENAVNENTTLYAHWTAKTATVTFDPNGGEALEETEKTKSVTYDSTYGELPPPTPTP